MPRRAAWRLWIDGLAGAASPIARTRSRARGSARRSNVLQAFLKARKIASLDACEQREQRTKSAFWFYVERVAGPAHGPGAGRDPAGGRRSAFPGPNPCAGPMTGRAGCVRCTTSSPSSTASWCPSRSISARPSIRTASPRARRPSAIASWGRRASPCPISRPTRPASACARSSLDPAERRHIIAQACRESRARTESLGVRRDEALLDEVVGLVEWPVVLMGRIDRGLHGPAAGGADHGDAHASEIFRPAGLPRAGWRRASSSSPIWRPRDHGATIVAGNERVLRARLADAQFFWDQDRKPAAGMRACRR